MTKQWILGVLILAVAWQVRAADLWTVYQLALQNDPTYQAASAQYEAAREAKPQAWAPLKPQISLQGQYNEIDQETKSSVFGSTGSRDFETDSYTLQLTQTLYRRDQFVGLDQADASVAQAEANFRNARHELIVRVAERYFAVLGAEDELQFARAEKEAIQQQLFQTKQRFEVGLTAITDVHEAQARFDQAVAQEIRAKNQLAVARVQLREITGQPQPDLAPVIDNMPLVEPEPADVDEWVKTAMDNNLSLLAAQKAVEVARAGVKIARSGHYPTLDLVAQHSNTDNNDPAFGRETEENIIGLQLNVPIYQGGAVTSATREAAANYQRAQDLEEQQRRATERQTRNAYLTTLSNISQVKAQKQALVSSQTALEATQAGFEVGTRTAVDVLDFQREVFRAKSAFAQSRYDYIVQTLRLQDAAGTLSDDDVRKINGWLQ